jgi:hypothetical protein
MLRENTIQQRAEIIYDLLDEKINYGYGESSPDYLDGLKAAFAIKNKSFKQFKRAFRESGLYFDIGSVEATWEDFSSEIPGPSCLTTEEKSILYELQELIDNESSYGRVLSL